VNAPAPNDKWASGRLYEPYVGRWSRRVAESFLPWIESPRRASWLDVGCGTGALIDKVLAYAAPRSVKGIDASEGFLATAREAIRDPRVTFAIADAEKLPDADGAFEAVVSGLVLNFVARPFAAAAEIARVLKPGGVAAAYVWDYAGKMQLMRHFWNAAVALDPEAREKDEGRRFPLCEPEALRHLWEGAGFRRVEVAAIDVETTFRDFDDYWTPFLSGQAPAPGYCMSLTEAARARLRDRLRDSLPFALDGTIPLVARAWAVKGRR
jgi:SAM-dependent methyltransferase